MENLTEKSRELRKNMTPQERKLWTYLRKRTINNLKFRRQYPIDMYIVDFICHEKMLIIEIDGGQHNEIDNREYDNKRTEYLESLGFYVLRFENTEVNKDIENVRYVINNVCDSLENGVEIAPEYR